MLRAYRTYFLDGFLILGLTAALVWPLFGLNHLDNWASIESTFIADGRYLKEHWPNPGWQPLWYCGTRFDYIYPPALRYGTAFLSKVFDVNSARGYHLYIGILYCVGIFGVYLMVRLASGRRSLAWLAAAGAALLSPSYLFIAHFRQDVQGLYYLPNRLNVLIRYGEGPHMSAFALLPIALGMAFVAFRKGCVGALAAAAIFSALVVSHNFYGATALAILFPLVVWAVWLTHRDFRVWLRAAAIAALAYGLTAFWLVPSYFQVTMRNLRLVSEPGNRWSIAVALAVAAVFALVSAKLARGRPERAYPVFVYGAATFLSLNVLGNYYFGFRVAGEPERLMPELDLALVLLALEGLRIVWGAGRWFPYPFPRARYRLFPLAAILLGAFAFRLSIPYVKHAWSYFPETPDYRQRVEYRITDWMAANMPESRALATGSVRFWYNAWKDLAQVGGGSEQGLLNEVVVPAQWQVTLGDDPKLSILWLQALGADAVIVHDRSSAEIYHDYVYPEKFANALPVAYGDGEGNVIYRVPRRFAGLARIVDSAKAAALKPVAFDTDVENLRAYVEVVENGPDSSVTWKRGGSDEIRLRAEVAAGQSILVQESYDTPWRAYAGGKTLPIRKDILGFMLVEAPPGTHDIRLVFELPRENFIGRIVTAASSVIVLALLLIPAFRRKEER